MLQECLEGLQTMNARAEHRTGRSLVACHCQVKPWLSCIGTKDCATPLTGTIILNNDIGLGGVCNPLGLCDAVEAVLQTCLVFLKNLPQRCTRSADSLMCRLKLIVKIFFSATN